LCEQLAVESVTVLERWGTEFDPDRVATSFGRFCDRAARRGIRVHLEFIPSTGIPDLETAWEVVNRADRENGGIVFDTRHYFRGTPDHETSSGQYRARRFSGYRSVTPQQEYRAHSGTIRIGVCFRATAISISSA
jgi:hypothetical protein